MRAFLQRSEVRLSTIHRVGQALLGGSALVLLLPLFLRDVIPRMLTVIISSHDGHQPWLPSLATGVAAALVILIPVPAIFLLVSDLLGFYFTSNTFGAHTNTAKSLRSSQVVFNPRFIIPGVGFNTDELSPNTRRLLEEGRADEWTRALLVPHGEDDGGWRDRFDTRTLEVWGTVAEAGKAGDEERMRQAFRLAGLHRDRTLALDVARTEALITRHVLHIRTVVLRYSKALLLLISTTVASLAASGLVEQAIREDPANGKFANGFPYRYMFLVALVYVIWAPLAARSVTSPLRMIQRHTPGVGRHADVYLDKKTTQFESAMVFVTAVVLVCSAAGLVTAGWYGKHTEGLLWGLGLAVAGTLAWTLALRDYQGSWHEPIHAAWLLVRGKEAPTVSPDLAAARAAHPADTAT